MNLLKTFNQRVLAAILVASVVPLLLFGLLVFQLQSLNGDQPLNNQTLSMMLGGAVLLCMITAVAGSIYLQASLNKQIGSLRKVFNRIGNGDYSGRAAVNGDDELGSMASSLNLLLDETQSLAKARNERDEISNSVRQLLNDVSSVANGNLTIKAAVNESVTGEVAMSFNDMVEKLRKIIVRVHYATREVSSAASEIGSNADSLAISNENMRRSLATRLLR